MCIKKYNQGPGTFEGSKFTLIFGHRSVLSSAEPKFSLCATSAAKDAVLHLLEYVNNKKDFDGKLSEPLGDFFAMLMNQYADFQVLESVLKFVDHFPAPFMLVASLMVR
jgi:hypothetical protein